MLLRSRPRPALRSTRLIRLRVAATGLFLILALCVAALALYLPDALRASVIEAAYKSNLEIADQIKITRGYYADNVVWKVLKSGALAGSFSHKGDDKAIPLPATFVKDISDLLRQKATSLSLVSPYPWPHRADRKLDEFETRAWQAFQIDPNAVFSDIDRVGGSRRLRIAVSDRMTSTACTQCHNSDPLSAKRDWKVGDVRAVMEVSKDIEAYLAAAEERAKLAVWTAGILAALAAAMLGVGVWILETRTGEKRAADAKLAYAAHHDALTHTLNRNAFSSALADALKQTSSGTCFAVHCLDLDGFKEVNDSRGHHVGDTLLKAVAARLHGCVKSSDMVARFGGDEFVVLQANIKSRAEAALLAARLCEVLDAPFDIDGHRIVTRASVGTAISPEDAAQAEELLKKADLASYTVKSGRAGGWRFFEPAMLERKERRRALGSGLRAAVDNDELMMVYQPIVGLHSNRVIGYEGLLRWNHPRHGLIMPGEFIPLAEETGLISHVGAWALRRACKDAAQWPKDLRLSLNISPAQFKDADFVQNVLLALAEAEFAPQRLELEITETCFMLNKANATLFLKQLQTFGVRIALDDFGMGYSSMSYLHAHRFDTLKIDRSFISDIGASDNRSLSIVQATLVLGRGMDMEVTIEGVETEGQLEWARALGCTNAQGFFLGRPKAVIGPATTGLQAPGAAAA